MLLSFVVILQSCHKRSSHPRKTNTSHVAIFCSHLAKLLQKIIASHKSNPSHRIACDSCEYGQIFASPYRRGYFSQMLFPTWITSSSPVMSCYLLVIIFQARFFVKVFVSFDLQSPLWVIDLSGDQCVCFVMLLQLQCHDQLIACNFPRRFVVVAKFEDPCTSDDIYPQKVGRDNSLIREL